MASGTPTSPCLDAKPGLSLLWTDWPAVRPLRDTGAHCSEEHRAAPLLKAYRSVIGDLDLPASVARLLAQKGGDRCWKPRAGSPGRAAMSRGTPEKHKYGLRSSSLAPRTPEQTAEPGRRGAGGRARLGDESTTGLLDAAQGPATGHPERPGLPVPAVPDGPLVISAGWGRTGTSSLKVGLDRLGLSPCFHARFFAYYSDLFETMAHYARTGQDVSTFPVRPIFRRFNAAVDIPAPLIPEVIKAYPEAKVILTIREPDKWYDSYVNSLLWLYRTWWLKPLAWVLPMGRKLQDIGRWWLLYEFGDDTMSDREACIRAVLAHNEHIKATVPPERLLVWKPQDGWEPLCEFLGYPVPAGPFPRENEGVREMAAQIVKFVLRHPLAALGWTTYDHTGALDFKSV